MSSVTEVTHKMLFDLHCDTLTSLYNSKEALLSNSKSVSIERYEKYSKKAQVFAIWSDKSLSDDEAYLRFMRVCSEFKSQLEENSDKISLCTTGDEIKVGTEKNKLCAILAVEDARLLSGDVSRLERLYESGVRILTLGWQGVTCIGGSHDTSEGLTNFGFEVLKECENLGITVDVSHLSEKSFWDVAGKATKPFIASHSNSYLLCNHRRNLTDVQIRTVVSSGGICGINLVGSHLSKTFEDKKKQYDTASAIEFACSHIEHFYEIAPEQTCLGLDLDGTEVPDGLNKVDKISTLFEALTNRGMDEQSAKDIFYNNAYNFFLKNLK